MLMVGIPPWSGGTAEPIGIGPTRAVSSVSPRS
jgi:hypothetical protein